MLFTRTLKLAYTFLIIRHFLNTIQTIWAENTLYFVWNSKGQSLLASSSKTTPPLMRRSYKGTRKVDFHYYIACLLEKATSQLLQFTDEAKVEGTASWQLMTPSHYRLEVAARHHGNRAGQTSDIVRGIVAQFSRLPFHCPVTMVTVLCEVRIVVVGACGRRSVPTDPTLQ